MPDQNVNVYDCNLMTAYWGNDEQVCIDDIETDSIHDVEINESLMAGCYW